MGRDIGSKAEPAVVAMAPAPGADDGHQAAPPPAGGHADYLERLYKIIPAELTAAYLAMASLLTDKTNMLNNAPTLLGFGVLLTVLTPFYLMRFQGVRSPAQLIVSTISFPVWAVCISTAVVTLAFPIIEPEMITVVLVGWVLVSPLLVPVK